MSKITPKDRERTIYAEGGGSNDDSGLNETFCKGDLAAANATAAGAVPPPSVFEPVLLYSQSGSRYAEDIDIEDFVRADLRNASIDGTVLLPETSYLRCASVVLAGRNNETAVSSNSKDQTTIECFGITTTGTGCTGYSIDGDSSDVFGTIGQIGLNGDNSTGLSFTSTGTPRRVQTNNINCGNSFTGSTPTGCLGIYHNTTSSEPLVVEGSAINQNAAGNKGIEVEEGVLISQYPDIDFNGDIAFDIKADGIFSHQGSRIRGDIENAGECQVFAQNTFGDFNNSEEMSIFIQNHEGNITSSAGSGLFQGQFITGNFNASSGFAGFSFQRQTGNIEILSSAQANVSVIDLDGDINMSSITISSFFVVSMAGDCNLGGNASTTTIKGLVGNLTVTSGLHLVDSNGVVGNVAVTGGSLKADITLVTGNLTLGAGSTFDGIISEVTGSVTIDPTATVNGIINGIKYGSWVDEEIDTNVWPFLRDGTIPTTWETIGALTIDTTTDSIFSGGASTTGVQGSYTQTSGATRTIEFRLIDADTLDVYYEGSNTATGANIRRYADLTATVTPLPTNQVVNLLLQNQRGGPGFGGGVNGGGGTIEIERT